MKLRPLLLIATICLLPLGALAWTTLHEAQGEQLVVRQQFQELFETRLQDVKADVANYFDSLERQLDPVVALDDFETESLRRISRNSPQILQLFVVSPQGALIYPDPAGPLNATEQTFLIKGAQMFTGRDLQSAVLRAEQENVQGMAGNAGSFEQVPSQIPFAPRKNVGATQQRERVDETLRNVYQTTKVDGLAQAKGPSGWFIWYWDRGVNLIYWQRRPSGHIVGCALDRARWISEVIAILPTTEDGIASPSKLRSQPLIANHVRLLNASAEVVYQWGQTDEFTDVKPLCEITLAEPLEPWRLQCFASTTQLLQGTGAAARRGALLGLLGLAAIMGSILWFFFREYARDMREAAQQVSFVNQVSHELRTPLTNISMYAELLERDIASETHPQAAALQQRLNIILSESQRLGRLIANVLTFARSKSKVLTLQPRLVAANEVVQAVVERARPMLEPCGVHVQTNFGASLPMQLDSDVLAQILENLLSNVEKYASQGGYVCVTTALQDEVLTIDVEDRGPGVEPEQREAIFRPFVRISSDLSHAAGTGIGLTIARELARLHGGELKLIDSTIGCHFQATLKTGSAVEHP